VAVTTASILTLLDTCRTPEERFCCAMESQVRPVIQHQLQASSVDHSEQDNHDRDDQQNVYETAHGVGSDKPQYPQDEHDDGDGIKHDVYSFQIQY
jgi:hypothetical protein